jgi:hypothetical protein
MKIETYEVEETNSEIATLAADGEAMELIEKLNLVGQLELTDTKTSTRFPYRKMTKLEHLVFKLHCPEETEISRYRSSIIPIRVLQVAALANEQVGHGGLLNAIKVWHPEDAKLDPVLVGHTSNYGGEFFLLARWGEVWKDFATLAQEAKAMWIMRRRASLSKVVKEAELERDNIEATADSVFTTGSQPTHAFYA